MDDSETEGQPHYNVPQLTGTGLKSLRKIIHVQLDTGKNSTRQAALGLLKDRIRGKANVVGRRKESGDRDGKKKKGQKNVGKKVRDVPPVASRRWRNGKKKKKERRKLGRCPKGGVQSGTSMGILWGDHARVGKRM